MAFEENVLKRRHLVGEVDVSRRVENVEQERLALDVLHQQADRHRLDGNAALLTEKICSLQNGLAYIFCC